LLAKEQITLGGRTGRGLRARIGPPFGLDMVVAIAAATPLVTQRRRTSEPASIYLAALRDAIRATQTDSGQQLEYSYYLLLTGPVQDPR
jgi:hypothetical protein